MHPWVFYLGNNNEHVMMASMLMFTLHPQTMCCYHELCWFIYAEIQLIYN